MDDYLTNFTCEEYYSDDRFYFNDDDYYRSKHVPFSHNRYVVKDSKLVPTNDFFTDYEEDSEYGY